MPSFKGFLKVVGPRLVAIAAAWVSAEITKRFNVTVEPESLTVIMLGTYAGVHKAISAKVNPGDAATERVGDAIKDAAGEAGPNEVVIPSKQP